MQPQHTCYQQPYPQPQPPPQPKPMGCALKVFMWFVGIHVAICCVAGVVAIIAPKGSLAPPAAPSPVLGIPTAARSEMAAIDAGRSPPAEPSPPPSVSVDPPEIITTRQLIERARAHLDAGPGDAGVLSFDQTLAADEQDLRAQRIARHDRSGRALRSTLRTIVARRESQATAVAAARAEAETRARCGDTPPARTEFWSSLQGAAEFLDARAHAFPHSFRVSGCSMPTLDVAHCWTSRCLVDDNSRPTNTRYYLTFSVGARQHFLGVIEDSRVRPR